MSTEQMTRPCESSGSCLCGGVRFQISGDLRPVIYCHCSQCRKMSGHYVAATSCDTDKLSLLSDATLTWYRTSATAQRGFCAVCGGNLFWKPDSGDHVGIFAGALDAPTGLTAVKHIFVADKADYYEIADGLPQHEVWDDTRITV